MDVKNCKRCRRIFNYISGEMYCPACKEEMESIFHKVRDYLKEHPGASSAEVSKQCEVSVEQILKWLREGRLELTADSSIILSCKVCGAPIRSGNFCKVCEQNLKQSFQDVMKKPNISNDNNSSSSNKSRMYTYKN